MLMTEMVCVCYSGFVQKPAVRSSVPSSIADTANSSNAESRTESTPITHNVTCITDTAAILADTQASLDLQSTSTSSNSHSQFSCWIWLSVVTTCRGDATWRPMWLAVFIWDVCVTSAKWLSEWYLAQLCCGWSGITINASYLCFANCHAMWYMNMKLKNQPYNVPSHMYRVFQKNGTPVLFLR